VIFVKRLIAGGQERIQVLPPEAECAVALEGGEVAEDSLVAGTGELPFDCLFDVRAGSVDELTNVLKDWFGEIGGLFNIGVHPRVFFSHGFNLLIEIHNTTIQRLRALGGEVAFAALPGKLNHTNFHTFCGSGVDIADAGCTVETSVVKPAADV
jgi:hypothetical protein